MRKITSLVIALFLLLSVFASAQELRVDSFGIAMTMDDDLESHILAQSWIDQDIVGLDICYFNMEVIAPVIERFQAANEEGNIEEAEAARQEYIDICETDTAVYTRIIGVPVDTAEETLIMYDLNDIAREIGSNSTYRFYIVDPEPNENLTAENAAIMEELRPDVDRIIGSAEFFEAVLPEPVASAVTSFESVDMDGNPVNESIFDQADLTVLNIWGTYCGPCISEMPELAAWAKELPENIQLIGLIVDVDSTSSKNYAKAQKIIDKCGVTYTNILVNDSLQFLMSGIVGVPTTLFIGRDGQAVREPVVGAYVASYKQVVEDFLAGK